MTIGYAIRWVSVLARRHLLHNLLWRRRLAIGAGALLLGLAALAFAWLADRASEGFAGLLAINPWLPAIITPAGYALIAWITLKLGPEARGSGIPQVIAAMKQPARSSHRLISLKVAFLKPLLTCAALLVGGSAGREGPTVQVSAAIMTRVHQMLKLPVRSSVLVAGGAAGVAAAFNTPLAGVAFAIEELASAYEQRMTLLVMSAVLISGMVSLGIAGDYVYFGAMHDTLSLSSVMVIAPVAGVLGGFAGGLFSRLVLDVTRRGGIWRPWARTSPVLWALGCGAIVAFVGLASGNSWGTGYEAARALIEGDQASPWFGLAKFIATLATALSGIPGGIFAPSLATGAGFGSWLSELFPNDPGGAVVLLGMIAYFTGVVRAPLTAVIIVSETTASRGLILPLFTAAIIADGSARLVCKGRLYHGLAKSFLPPSRDKAPDREITGSSATS